MGKFFLSYEEQLKKLREEKALNILDKDYALEMLKRYSYYSLISGYKKEFKNPDTTLYRSDVYFEDIVALYEFDENLRGLFLKYLQKIDRQIKSYISYYFCEKYGELQEKYLDIYNYNYIGKNKRDIDRLVQILGKYTNGHTDYHYINHAYIKYNNVPLWVLTNALTFGNISKFYLVSKYDIQAKIARNYTGIRESHLSKMLIVLTQFRNICAHGERLYCYHTKQAVPDLLLHQKLDIPKKSQEYIYGKHDLFAVVLSMRYLLPNDWFLSFKKELIKVIRQYVERTSCFSEKQILKFMGFPENWTAITRYRMK